MFWKNFITLLRRYTVSSLLNIIGMSVAFASVYLLMVQVVNDLSYNKKIPDADLIYRMEYPSFTTDGNWGTVWNRILPQAMCDAVPEVESRGAIYPTGVETFLSYVDGNEIRNIKLKMSKGDNDALDVFGFDFVAGNAENFGPQEVIIKESKARHLGLEVGDQIHIGHGAKGNKVLNVIGIYRDFPEPSYLHDCDAYVGLPPINVEEEEASWGHYCYVRLYEGVNPDTVAHKMREWLREALEESGLSEEEIEEEMSFMSPRLNPLTRLYFATECDNVTDAMGNITTTYTLLAIAILILIIALINFINFFFALIPVRIKTVNNLKIFGAPTFKLRMSFLLETLGLICLSILGASAVVVFFADTPLINYISASVGVVDNWRLIISLILIFCVVGLMMSLYPSWYITRFSPAMLINGSFHATKSGRVLRYMLIGIQYVISLVLIIFAIFIHRQHQFMRKHDLGFDKERLYVMNVGISTIEKYNTLSDILKQNPIVDDVTFSDHFLVSQEHGGWYANIDGHATYVAAVSVAWNFLDFMDIELTEGRDFKQSDTLALIMNETGHKMLDVKLDNVTSEDSFMNHIVGFSEDYEARPLHFDKVPLCFMVNKEEVLINYVYIRLIRGVAVEDARAYILDVFTEFGSGLDRNKYEERLHFADNLIEDFYQTERKLSILITIFTCISILISLMGVFGLVLFETQYRRHEIAIRRVNGATVKDILKMFNAQFIKVVTVCSAIAIPLSYYIVDKYLSNFANRVSLSAWVFVLSVVAIIALTIAVVTLRSWKAANENPVEIVN